MKKALFLKTTPCLGAFLFVFFVLDSIWLMTGAPVLGCWVENGELGRSIACGHTTLEKGLAAFFSLVSYDGLFGIFALPCAAFITWGQPKTTVLISGFWLADILIFTVISRFLTFDLPDLFRARDDQNSPTE